MQVVRSDGDLIIEFSFLFVNQARMRTCGCDRMMRLMESLRSAVNMAADLRREVGCWRERGLLWLQGV